MALAGDGAPGEGRADGMKDTAHKHRHRVHRVAHLGRAALLRRAKRLRNLSWRFLHRKWIWRIAIVFGLVVGAGGVY